jgi:AAA+ ATPase superfamily predicted ATPase
MEKFFNTAGPCLPERHYMIPPERRLGQVRELIDRAAFFVIHAPRQTGKTTLIRALSRKLTKEGKYAALTVSLESLTRRSVKEMIPQLLRQLIESAEQQLPKTYSAPNRKNFANDPDVGLKAFLSAWANRIDRPLVLKQAHSVAPVPPC